MKLDVLPRVVAVEGSTGLHVQARVLGKSTNITKNLIITADGHLPSSISDIPHPGGLGNGVFTPHRH